MPESQFDPATQVSKVCRYVTTPYPRDFSSLLNSPSKLFSTEAILFLNGIVRLVLTLAGHQQIQFCEIKSQNT